jgi:hypothetical protein
MFLHFLDELRSAKIPASLKEHLMLLEAMQSGVIENRVEEFYYLSRAIYVKDEGLLDRFDQVFGKVFKGLETTVETGTAEIPEEWLRKLAELYLTPEEMAEIKSLGSWDEIMETLKKRLEEQQKRHEGGNKWIGTAGKSPFGANGYNPEGVRIGQDQNRQGKALKVWDKREYKNLDSTVELGTRNIKVALRRLRKFAREGAADELDLDATIKGTARKAYLDIVMRPERHNAVKLLLFLDVGGSMDPHIKVMEELFSAARTEFKHLVPQLPLGGGLEGQQAPLVGTDADLRRAPQVPARLQAAVRGRRLDEPLRDQLCRGIGGALERGGRRSLDEAADGRVPQFRLAEPDPRAALDAQPVDPDDEDADGGADVPADAGRARSGDARAFAQSLVRREGHAQAQGPVGSGQSR